MKQWHADSEIITEPRSQRQAGSGGNRLLWGAEAVRVLRVAPQDRLTWQAAWLRGAVSERVGTGHRGCGPAGVWGRSPASRAAPQRTLWSIPNSSLLTEGCSCALGPVPSFLPASSFKFRGLLGFTTHQTRPQNEYLTSFPRKLCFIVGAELPQGAVPSSQVSHRRYLTHCLILRISAGQQTRQTLGPPLHQ